MGLAVEFWQALRADELHTIAFVGGGGKTTAMFTLARQLSGPVWVTTTTHLSVEQANLADQHLIISNNFQTEIQSSLSSQGVTLWSSAITPDNRVRSLPADALLLLHEQALMRGIPLLIEADGAKCLPIKAPASHEPVIPEWVDGVVVVAGASGIGQPLDDSHVHRPQLFAALSGQRPGEVVSMNGLARVLGHPAGGLKGIPGPAKRIALINQVDQQAQIDGLLPLEKALLSAFEAVLFSSLKSPGAPVWRAAERTAGIVLAAGSARRFGRPKQLLDYQGEPFVRRVARTALAARCSPVIVVLGSQAEEVAGALNGLPVQIVQNPDWESGQSSSIQAGLHALPAWTGAALFLLADQPQVSPETLRGLIDRHAQTRPALLAARVSGRRANPVLFDRDTFSDLFTLRGDVGGRGIFDRHALEYLDLDDTRLLLDVDTEEDYRRLLGQG